MCVHLYIIMYTFIKLHVSVHEYGNKTEFSAKDERQTEAVSYPL